MHTKVLIKGAGEHASGTAHRLFRCGFRVVMTDIEHPTAVRRAVSFSSAVYQKEITVEGVTGVAYTLDAADSLGGFDWRHIPVFVDPAAQLVKLWKPDVLIDGRILKERRDSRIDDAPLVIGYGPALVAGRDAHFIVETSRGHDLGRIISEGTAAPDTGVPGAIGGYTVERVLRAPADGTLCTKRDIGDQVKAGERIATVGDCDITAAIPGVIRGLLLDGSTVIANQKLGDIDPRGVRSYCYTLSDKTRTISGAALEIILSCINRR